MAWKNVQYDNGKYRTSEGGGGGSSTFADLDDVNFSNIQNGQVPKYNSTTQKWENANESGGGGTVTDVTVDGTSVVNQQGVAEIPAIPDGLHHYSTIEQVVGVYDGKPLYEKTFFDIPLTHNRWTTVFDATGLNVDKYIHWWGGIAIGGNNTIYCNVDYFRGTSEFACSTPSSVFANIVSPEKLVYFTVQYTKTTD